MTQISFIVRGEPIPMPRPRLVMGKFPRIISNVPKHKSTPYKQHIRMMAQFAYKGPPLEGPVHLKVTFVMPRPQYLIWKTKPMPRVWHDKIPDADNMVKAVQDALKGVAWKDDGQICVTEIYKYVAAGGEEPHTAVVINDLPGVTYGAVTT